MQFRELFENWSPHLITLDAGFMSMEWAPQNEDKDAAWELCVELATRSLTQALPDGHGDEKTALDSIYKLFAVTRMTLKKYGRRADSFAAVALFVLNRVVRPFTTEWHPKSLRGEFSDPAVCRAFRHSLVELQEGLRSFQGTLVKMAGLKESALMLEEA